MAITNTDNQDIRLKEKIKDFFILAKTRATEEYCPVRDLFATTTDKWSLFVIYNLGYSGTMRFNELKKRIPNISSRMLSVTLKKMVSYGMATRTVHAQVPPSVEYTLTDFGREMADKMIDLNRWFMEAYDAQEKA